MNSSVPNAHVLYTVDATAWLLGMPRSEVHRAIRIGALHAAWRGGVPLVPAYVLVRLLGQALPEPTHAPPDRQGGGGGAR